MFTLSARADELFEYQKPVHAYGAGGVYLPWVSDTDAVVWNPAQLANVGALSWNISSFNLGANGSDVYNLYQEMQNSNCSGSSCYSAFYGKPLYVSYGGQTAFAMPYWGVTFYTMGMMNGTLHNPAFPSLNLNYLSDTGYAFGLGMPLGAGLSVGGTVKRITRAGGNQDVSIATLTSQNANILDGFTQNGTGYGMDLALMYQTPAENIWKTSVVLDWQDVGSTAFLPNGTAEAPPRIKDNLSLGVGSVMDLPGLDLKVGMEYRHITTQGEQIGKKLHFGTELSMPLIDIQVGLNQGYPTLGLGFDLFFLRFDVAQYTEETGVYPGQSPSNRFKMGLSLDLSVDADFKFVTKDGKKRKLKQRR